MAHHLKADFSRIQFTPDLLPSDVTGTDIYYSEGGKGAFRFRPGPVFGNALLADAINRAPAKVQAAPLEAMEERQVTVGQETHALPRLFILEVAGPIRPPQGSARNRGRRVALMVVVPGLALAALFIIRRRDARPQAPRPPSEKRLFRALRRSVLRDPIPAIRPRLNAWLTALRPDDPAPAAAIAAAMLALERTHYGQAGSSQEAGTLRRALLATLEGRRTAALARAAGVKDSLPPLNPFDAATLGT